MTIEMIRAALGRCSIINMGLLLWRFLVITLAEENNIEYNVTNEWSGGIVFHATGMDVMVPEEKAEEAEKIIRDFKDKK